MLHVARCAFKAAYDHGYASSRAAAFLQQDTVVNLLTIRAIPDTIFLVGVVVLVVFCIKALFNLRKPTHQEIEPLPVKDLAGDED
jgi:nitric oxide reductase subunit B